MQAPPTLPELLADRQPPGDAVGAIPRLVSRSTGVIRTLERVPRDPGEPFLPHVFRAEVANHRFLEDETPAERMASGKGMTLAAARASAVGEAAERYSAECFDDSEIHYAPWHELDASALDPRELVLFAPEQYGEVPYAPYDPGTVFGWVPARSLVSGREVLVPALGVYMGYRATSPKEWIFAGTSNGLAAGASLAGAVLAALLEVLERDAYLITWLHRLPCERIEPWEHPDGDVTDLREAYRRRGVELHLFRLPTDHPATVHFALAVETDGDGPATVVGLGADPDPARSARGAVLEVGQGRPSLRRHLRLPEIRARVEELVEDPSRVEKLEDHDLLYADGRTLGAFEFLLERPPTPGEWSPPRSDPGDELRRLVEHFRSTGVDVLYCDLTPPDMRSLGLHTARVIVPGFQPIHFGWGERRLGGTRLFELPVRLGLAPRRLSPAELNPDPHPLA